MKKNLLGIIAITISIVALVFSIVRVAPFTITEGTYIGIIAAFIGISVAILIGYQIFNVIDWKDKMQQFKKQQDELNQQSDKIKTELNSLELDYHKKLLNILVLFYRDRSHISEVQRRIPNAILYELMAIKLSIKSRKGNIENIFLPIIFKFIISLKRSDFGLVIAKRKENFDDFKKKVNEKNLIIQKQCNDSVPSWRLFQEIKNALDKKIEFIDKYIDSTDGSNMEADNITNKKFIIECFKRFKEIRNSVKK
jgi:hypothetical protein